MRDEVVLTMVTDEDEWTDEDSSKELVKRANRLSLCELKEIILSFKPSFLFTAKNG